MIAVIRIKGQVGLKKEIVETLNRLRIRKKYSCVIIDENPVNLGMLKRVKEFVAYGKIDEPTLKELTEKRSTKTKNFFRLHPPRGGIASKKQFGVGRGVLGDHKEKINDLIKRML